MLALRKSNPFEVHGVVGGRWAQALKYGSHPIKLVEEPHRGWTPMPGNIHVSHGREPSPLPTSLGTVQRRFCRGSKTWSPVHGASCPSKQRGQDSLFGQEQTKGSKQRSKQRGQDSLFGQNQPTVAHQRVLTPLFPRKRGSITWNARLGWRPNRDVGKGEGLRPWLP